MPANTRPVDANPNSEQLQSAEQFLAAYNEIDRHMRNALGFGYEKGFSLVLAEYAKKRSVSSAVIQNLQDFGELRNVLIHRKYSVYGYMAAPVPGVVQSIQQIRDDMLRPEQLLTRFRRNVAALQVNDSLATALSESRQHDYSQFPVYAGEAFKGLLTQNGIARWLASEIAETIMDFSEVPIGKVLKHEEKRKSFSFAKAQTTLFDAIGEFARNPELEAILVTHSGQRHEKPLGIITAWDIAHLA